MLTLVAHQSVFLGYFHVVFQPHTMAYDRRVAIAHTTYVISAEDWMLNIKSKHNAFAEVKATSS